MAPFSSFPLHSSSSSLPHAPPSILKLPTIFQPPPTTTTAVIINTPQLTHPNNSNSSSNNNNMTADSLSVVIQYHGKKRKCRNPLHPNSAKTQPSKEKKTKKKVQKKKREGEEEEESPKGYIHVRARRGQATDSHSLAERVRRERISERMKLLQALVPGCDKVTGKALMLDEIINYVQSLQNQVELLSMKLASVNPMFYDFGMDLLESFMLIPQHHQLQDLSNTYNLAAMESSTALLTPPNSNYNNNNNFLENIFPQPQISTHLLLQGSRQSLWEMEDNNTLLSSLH